MEQRLAYESWHEDIPPDDATSPWHNLLRDHLILGDISNKRVLEIGCGRGGMSRWLAGFEPPPAQIVAADFAMSAIRKPRYNSTGRGLARIEWEVTDITAIAHPDESFDTVISCETIEHVPDPPKAVAELARVLKRGGRLYLTTPNYLSFFGLYRMYLWFRGRPFTEAGQPINKLVLLPLTRAWIIRSGLRVTALDSRGYYLVRHRRPPLRLPFDRPKLLMRWFGERSFLAAVKP